MLQEIIPIMDFNCNYNLVSVHCARFLLTVVNLRKVRRFQAFYEIFPRLFKHRQWVSSFILHSYLFLLWLGNSRISFRVSFFQATFTFCPSPIPAFHSPLFPGVLFLSSIISNQVGAHLISSIVWNKHRGHVKKYPARVSQNQVLSPSTTPSTPCLSVSFLILTVTNSRLPDFFSFREG